MIIVGEKINTSLKGVTEAVRNRDAAFIQQRAREQAEKGAHYIDVNCGTLVSEEVEALAWLVETVQEAVDLPCCIDSPDPLAIASGLKVHRGKPLINSITAEEGRYQGIIPLVKEYKAGIIALLIDDAHGMPHDAATRIQIGCGLVKRLMEDGVAVEDIYIDPLIQPIGTSTDMGVVAIETIQGIKKEYPGIHFMCGLSNVSFGLPKRGLLNRTFLALCMMAGLDGAILDPGNREMMKMIVATEALLDRDEYCMGYIQAFRSGLLDD
ncbi:methyltetrahydrofolate cobalamin methyltransferase [Geosporobacter ferrireducens]|uniref:Methyltetrahydrofolate--corrinoid methyltransferase n=1 Tax=Geosporobacter ferrireducens TaxID=1424294 RepID=A0A1D8GJW8_9FIRM|nr:methyltetrahydrofolate cobalamin methyltransferase [Geosporobacter ferrireducens]AOT71208.1 methyltetrahydrofolate--corrinoid methyltransferase [Geosporobacter ferrireducens]MTI58021.1 methyltetrahydrofolate cobalamin methyltransferase [Geosporobacter ferrireducens]